jgi:hypothetical protein
MVVYYTVGRHVQYASGIEGRDPYKIASLRFRACERDAHGRVECHAKTPRCGRDSSHT